MPIIFDEVSAEITPPAPTSSSTEGRSEGAQGTKVDAQSLLRELQRVAERAERLHAD
jgi:hypothetical protein